MMDEMTFTLNSPLTEEEWDLISDVDFDNTDEITFHTKHGKEVTFVKRKTGRWIDKGCGEYRCLNCRNVLDIDMEFMSPKSIEKFNFCPFCGCKMEVEHDSK